MSDKISKLYEDRTKLVEDQRAILDKAETEERDLSAEETEQYEKMEADFDKLTDDIKGAEERKEQSEERAKKLEEREEYLKSNKYEEIKPDPAEDRKKDDPEKKDGEDEYRQAFVRFLIRGEPGLLGTGFESRALQADDSPSGGYLVTPEQFINDLIKDLENSVFVRRYAKVIQVPNAASLGVPELGNRISDPTWTEELKVGDEDTTMDFKKRALYPHPLARYIKVSKKLLRVARLNVEAEVREGLVYEFATVEENAFLNGNGSNQPLGVMVASDSGISTDRDESTGNVSTAIKADGLINALYKMKAQYRARCRWAFHRDALKMIRKLKTGEGDYIWQSGIGSDRPATILGKPYDESEYMPSTFTAGEYVGILADWNYYWIADALDMQIQVLTERFAMSNQNAYIGRKETDGAPVHENGFVRVKLA